MPFLDHDFVEVAATWPPDLKLGSRGEGVPKEPSRSLLPAEVIYRTKGYSPVAGVHHLNGPVLGMLRDALTNNTRTMLGSNTLWRLAVLEMWLQSMKA